MSREHVHLIGVGGTGMTALAGLLAESGCRVTGSDGRLYPPTSNLLAAMDVEVHEGFDAARMRPAPDLVVVGNAISRGNPELEAALDADLNHTSMPRLLGDRFLRGRHPIVVMGTHGKTTTSSMIAWVLQEAGLDPGYLIGGLPRDLERPYRLGRGAPFVVEGDEYDSSFDDKGPKFMHYRPRTAVLGTVEFDHADIYRDLDQVRAVFRRVAHLVPSGGLLIRHEDSEVTREVSERCFSRRTGFGLQAGEWRAVDLEDEGESSRFTVEHGGRPFADVQLDVGGPHNVLNALATCAVCDEHGVAGSRVGALLSRFRGVRRRLDVVGTVDGIRVIDDFAHHPTAIDLTLTTLARRGTGRLWAVLEPRSGTLRRNVFQDRLPAALRHADEILIAPVFQPERIDAGERLDVDRLVADLCRAGRSARGIAGADDAIEQIASGAQPGDTVAVLSNGGFDGLIPRLVAALERRAGEAAAASLP